MDFGEGINKIGEILEEKCDHKPDKKNWKCVLKGETDSHLIPNITRDRDIPRPIWPAPNGSVSINDVNADIKPPIWPHEAHHLIPWQQLEKHGVIRYLDAKKDKIWTDNDYSVNHGNNGLFMPNSSRLAEWKGLGAAAQQDLSNDLMDKVVVQLHQSRHSFKQYDGAEEGYKRRVIEYLETITDDGLKHMDICDPCKNNKKGKKIPPRENIVRAMDRISKNLEYHIGDMDIFVSKRSAAWAKKHNL